MSDNNMSDFYPSADGDNIRYDGHDNDGLPVIKPGEDINENGVSVPKSVLKSVYCNYRGYLIVYDIHGKKVYELSGELTYEKYLGIEDRADKDITEFDGIDDYRCFACELKKKAKEIEGYEDYEDYDPFSPPIQQSPIAGGALPGGGALSGRGVSSGGGIPRPTQRIASIQPPMGIQHNATPPVSPSMGELYYDTVKNEIGVWDGTYWNYNQLAPAYRPNGKTKLKFITSAYHANEQEVYTVQGLH